jgi:hypothetical protein
MKRSLPKPAHLEIRIDEWQVVQGDPDGIAVVVEWRGARKDPTFAELLAALPPRMELVPIRLPDGRTDVVPKQWNHVRIGGGPPVFKRAQQNWEGWGHDLWSRGSRAKARRELTDMIRRYVPNFDDYTDEKQIAFMIRTQKKINEVRDSLEGLIGHLEYAAPDKRKARPPLENPSHNVRAAVFTAMSGSSRRAGELLGIPLPPSDEVKHENETVRTAAKQGRELLIHYFGEAEWKAKVERMREYRRWWEYLESIDDSKEQFYAMLAKACGTSLEHERLRAERDGFDKKLEEWVAAYEQKENAMDTFWQTKGDVEQDEAKRAEDRAWHRMKSLESSDERFDAALSLFDKPPQG